MRLEKLAVSLARALSLCASLSLCLSLSLSLSLALALSLSPSLPLSLSRARTRALSLACSRKEERSHLEDLILPQRFLLAPPCRAARVSLLAKVLLTQSAYLRGCICSGRMALTTFVLQKTRVVLFAPQWTTTD